MSPVPQISVTSPLGGAWLRMKLFLFQPFDLGKWFVVGFAAFLAGLGSSGNGPLETVWNIDDDWGWDRHEISAWPESMADFLEEIFSSLWMVGLASFLFALALVVAVLVLWVSSRARFVLLDNLVTGQQGITAPWRRHARLGDSLFRWQLIFTLVCLLVFGTFTAMIFLVFVPMGLLGIEGILALPAVILLGALGFALAMTVVFVEFFLHHFVAPIMYKHQLSTNAAWARFKTLFSKYPGWFILYGILYLIVGVVGSMALMLGGVLTCCLGLLLLMLPYIGSVVSLPLTVLQRYWDLEFLSQFGPDFEMLGPVPSSSGHGSIYDDADRTVVGPEDVAEDVGGDQPGPQDA